jgi:hypothetical protein
MGKTRQCLLCSGGAGQSGPTALLPCLACLRTVLSEGLSARAAGRRLPGRSGDEEPAWLDTPIGGPQRVLALALRQRRHGLWSSLGQGGLGVAPGGGDAGEPFALRLGKGLAVRVALAGPIGHPVGGPVGGGPWRAGLLDALAALQASAAGATARLQQDRHPRLGLAHPRQHAWMQGGPVVATSAPGARHDLCGGGLGAVVASVDLEAGGVEMRKGGNEPQTRGGPSCTQAGEFGPPILVEPISGTSPSLVIELGRGNTGRNESRRRLMVAAAGDAIARMLAKPQALEPPRLDRLPNGEVPHCRGL